MSTDEDAPDLGPWECDYYHMTRKNPQAWQGVEHYSIGCYASGNDDMASVIAELVAEINALRKRVGALEK